jgi:integral membrane sensor domain MASE1
MSLTTLSLTTLALIALFPLLVWRVYSRLKTQMARQRSILSRHYTGLFVFAAMVLVPGSELVDRPFQLAALAGGAIAGMALGSYGLRRTRFEDTPEGYFFTPPARMGILVAMLLVARVLYLGIEIYMNQGSSQPNPRFTDSPITMLCLGLTAAYFATFSASLMRWRQRKRKEVSKM